MLDVKAEWMLNVEMIKDVMVKMNPNSDSGFFAIQKNNLENSNSHFEKK